MTGVLSVIPKSLFGPYLIYVNEVAPQAPERLPQMQDGLDARGDTPAIVAWNFPPCSLQGGEKGCRLNSVTNGHRFNQWCLRNEIPSKNPKWQGSGSFQGGEHINGGRRCTPG